MISFDEETRRQIGLQIGAARERLGLKLDVLADKAECDERTVRNAIAGKPVRYRTLLAICRAVRLDIPELAQASGARPATFGYAVRSDVEHYEGCYVIYYRNLVGRAGFCSSALRMRWDDATAAVSAEEYTELMQDGVTPFQYTMHGHLHFNEDVGLAQVLLNDQGVLELMTVSRLQRETPFMYGSLLTQVYKLIYYQPTYSPVVLEKLAHDDFDKAKKLSRAIEPGQADFARVKALIEETESKIARM